MSTSTDEPMNTYIESELMAYIFTYLDSSSIESLQNVKVKHFNPEEISEAKESLWKAYTQSITLPYISRRDGKESAAVKDIVHVTHIIWG